MNAQSSSYASTMPPIPDEKRERVFVDKFGPGLTTHRQWHGGFNTGIRVELDDGTVVIAAPREVRPYVDGQSNVVMFPSRVIAR